MALPTGTYESYNSFLCALAFHTGKAINALLQLPFASQRMPFYIVSPFDFLNYLFYKHCLPPSCFHRLHLTFYCSVCPNISVSLMPPFTTSICLPICMLAIFSHSFLYAKNNKGYERRAKYYRKNHSESRCILIILCRPPLCIFGRDLQTQWHDHCGFGRGCPGRRLKDASLLPCPKTAQACVSIAK